VVPEFYDRNDKGFPVAWIARMRKSMAQLTPRFSADRAVREYTEQHYLPAAEEYLERSANKGAKGRQISESLQNLGQNWGSLRFGEVLSETTEKEQKFTTQVYFYDLDPDKVQVELFADGIGGEAPTLIQMTRGEQLAGLANSFHYSASITATRAAADYTVRAIPFLPDVSVPLEFARILWQR
jgi:glycogen phosphorylase